MAKIDKKIIDVLKEPEFLQTIFAAIDLKKPGGGTFFTKFSRDLAKDIVKDLQRDDVRNAIVASNPKAAAPQNNIQSAVDDFKSASPSGPTVSPAAMTPPAQTMAAGTSGADQAFSPASNFSEEEPSKQSAATKAQPQTAGKKDTSGTPNPNDPSRDKQSAPTGEEAADSSESPAQEGADKEEKKGEEGAGGEGKDAEGGAGEEKKGEEGAGGEGKDAEGGAGEEKKGEEGAGGEGKDAEGGAGEEKKGEEKGDAGKDKDDNQKKRDLEDQKKQDADAKKAEEESKKKKEEKEKEEDNPKKGLAEIQNATAELLKSCWQQIIPTWGLSYLYILVHNIAYFFGGSKIFGSPGKILVPSAMDAKMKKVPKVVRDKTVGAIEKAGEIAEGCACIFTGIFLFFAILILITLFLVIIELLLNPSELGVMVVNGVWSTITK